MLIGKARKVLFMMSLIFGGVIIFGLGALSAKAYLSRDQTPAKTSTGSKGPFMTEGFDFKMLRSTNNEWGQSRDDHARPFPYHTAKGLTILHSQTSQINLLPEFRLTSF